MNISVSYEENLIITVIYAFSTFNLLPRRPKKKRKFSRKKTPEPNSKPPPDEKETKSNFEKLLEKLTKKEMRSTLKKCLKLIARFFKKFMRRINIDELNLNLAITTEDAYKTALIYGGISSVLYPLFTAIKNYDRCKICNLNLTPGFLIDKSYFSFNLELSIKPIFSIIYIIPLLFDFLHLLVNTKKKNN